MSEVCLFIIAFNNPTYVRDTVNQLLKYSKKIIIIDNHSTYPPMIDYLQSVDGSVKVLRMDKNYGSVVHLHPVVQSHVSGDVYCVTDPDLRFNKDMPINVIDTLVELTEMYKVQRAGLALDITHDIRDDVRYSGKLIREWEAPHWQTRIPHPSLILYHAGVDTTFCVVNKKYSLDNTLRVAGDFTCVHRPWLTYWREELPVQELAYYKSQSKCSSWI